MKRKFLVFIPIIILAILVIASGLYLFLRPDKEQDIILRIGYQPSTHHIAHIIAMEKGWWKERLKNYGIVDVKEYLFPTGPPEMSAMLAGEIDVAYVGVTPPITAIYEGLEAKIIASVQLNGSDLVARSGFSYTGPQSLKEARIATFPPGSIQDTILKKWLNQNRIDFHKDVKIYPMGPGEAVSALKAVAIDAAFLPHPSPTIIELEGFGKSVEQSGKMWKNGHICCVLLISERFMEKYPDIAEEILKIHYESTQYAKTHINEASEIYSEKMGIDLNIIKKSFESWDGELISNPYLAINSTIDFATAIYELNRGRYEHPLNQIQLFNLSIWDKITSNND
ncbi:MAG: ABC transporter substrate-binding protein [Candidatus Helarchaeota archaeon]|nr:ABC transporter substrate-binding protein [Candidatus Helarchaeota archaeon]